MDAVYAGSFDPFTFGHMDIVTQGLNLFDCITIVCAVNAKKKLMFSRDKMVEAIKKSFKSYQDRVNVIQSDELIIDICNSIGADYIIRGLRNNTDYMYEEEIAKFNSLLDDSIQTIYFRSENSSISSSAVKELFVRGKDVSRFVPQPVIDVMCQCNIHSD